MRKVLVTEDHTVAFPQALTVLHFFAWLDAIAAVFILGAMVVCSVQTGDMRGGATGASAAAVMIFVPWLVACALSAASLFTLAHIAKAVTVSAHYTRILALGAAQQSTQKAPTSPSSFL